MGTKNSPGSFDCYANAAPDEPMFVLLGRDAQAPQLVELWARSRAEDGEDPAKIEEALRCAKAMRKWYRDHKGLPACEYCEESAEDCKKVPTHLVTEDDGCFVHWYWCGNFDSLCSGAGVLPIEEYFSSDAVSNSYIDDLESPSEVAT